MSFQRDFPTGKSLFFFRKITIGRCFKKTQEDDRLEETQNTFSFFSVTRFAREQRGTFGAFPSGILSLRDTRWFSRLPSPLLKMRLYLSLFALICTFGCGPQLSVRAPGDPVLAHPAPLIPPDPTHLKRAAWAHFQRGDYVRALRLSYRAADLAPEDAGPAFLSALIYDLGMDRPDLAIFEYNRLLQRAAHHALLSPLHPRLTHLSRVALQRAATAALMPGHPPPLVGAPLSVMTFHTDKPDPSGLPLALTDLLLYDLQILMGADLLSPLQMHLLSRTFQEAFPEAPPSAFARWTGAQQTLVGKIARKEAHHIVVSTRLLDATGTPVHHLKPVEGNLGDLPALRRALRDETARALGLHSRTTTAPQPIASALALSLCARGLDAYLSGDATTAERLLTDAEKIEPGAPLITRWRHWIKEDIQGAQMAAELTALYKKRSIYPDPQTAVQRRLTATHALIAPATGLNGKEPSTPHNPPRTEANP